MQLASIFRVFAVALFAGGQLFFGPMAQAQSVQQYLPCLTDEHNLELEAADPTMAPRRDAINAQIRQILDNPDANAARLGPASRIVPTVVHVVHQFGAENVSVQVIKNSIEQMNRDLMRRNSDTLTPRTIFQSVAADMDFEFRLATLDPRGNPTDGVVRNQNAYTRLPSTRDSIKIVEPAWDPTRYFNIWVINTISSSAAGTVIAYAQFPTSSNWMTYGIVTIYQGLSGHTMAHEMGHCLNLYHTFQGGCGSSCASSGDLVCDTPPSSPATYGCVTTQNSCSNDSPNQPDMIENFMSYDRCQNMFTKGQRARSEAAIAAIPTLRGLFSASNLISTGVDSASIANPPALVPVAHFGSTASRKICQGSTVPLLDGSYNGTPDATWEYTYIVPGTIQRVFRGNGLTGRNISVRLDSAGEITITQIVKNAVGADTLTRTLFSVQPRVGRTEVAGGVSFKQNFDSNTLNIDPDPTKNFTADGGASGWNLFNTSAPSGGDAGSRSLRVLNRSGSSGVIRGRPRYLYLPAINYTGWVGVPKLYFQRAIVRRFATPSSDSLAIDWSTNCGNNWSARKNWVMDTIRTLYTSEAFSTNITWTPTSTDWVLDSLPLTLSGTLRQNVVVRFAMYGNNASPLYIDGIQIGSAYERAIPLSNYTGGCAQCLDLEIVPNPAGDDAVLEVNNGLGGNEVAIVDAMGRVVASQVLPLGGSHTVSLKSFAPRLQNGIYMVRLQYKGGQLVRRMVVAH